MADPKAFNDWSSMSPQSYISSRLDEQLAWYDKKSASNKAWYYRWQIIALVASSIVPILALASGEVEIRVAVACLGAIAAIAAGVMSMYQFRDQWQNYRTTAEVLKYEKFLYVTGSAPYNTKDSFGLFVNRVESTILKENNQWQERHFSADVTSNTTLPDS